MDEVAESGYTHGVRSLRVLLAVLIALGTALVALHDWLDLGGGAFAEGAEGWLYDAVVVAAGASCLLRSRSAGRERTAWAAIGASILVWAAAEIYWTVAIVGDPAPPYPSPADAGYLAFYPLAALGLVLLVRARAEEIEWRLWMDGAIAALGTAALGTAFVFDFVADQTSGTSIQVATTLAYPLGDILLLSMVVGVVALTGWRPGRAWTPLLVGLTVMAGADVAYTLQSTDLGLPEGLWVEPLYLIAAAFLAVAAWQSRSTSIHSRPRSRGWRELMEPAVFAGVMIGLAGMQQAGSATDLSGVLRAATMVAIIVRLAISDRENKRLLEQVRTDPLTGLASRGALQVDLEGVCAKATEKQPISILLFDLNGFKGYNDTCGHPAGDQLLAELGGRLNAVVAGAGTAYRIGGDEFCVVLSGDGEALDEFTREAAIALTTRRNGVDVSAAWGSVSIPAEADTSHEAMQLADVRMYAQKEGRRAARQKEPVVPQLGPQAETETETPAAEQPLDSPTVDA
jgi:two-component system cell cycle response regulator